MPGIIQDYKLLTLTRLTSTIFNHFHMEEVVVMMVLETIQTCKVLSNDM